MVTSNRKGIIRMISIIVPVHNTFLYIRECMESILKQTYPDLEIICVDSSTDETTNVLREIAEQDSRIRVILDSNSSYGYKVNLGIREAKGDYVAVVDSDDYIDPDMYQKLLETLLEQDVDFVKSDYSSFYVEDGQNIGLDYVPNALDPELYGKCISSKSDNSILYKTNISIWAGLYKKEFLLQNEIYLNESEGASFQDAGFSVLTHVLADKIYYLQDTCYRYRTDNVNSSVKSQKKYRTVADEWKYIETQLEQRGCMRDDLLVPLRCRKILNYEWNYERLDEEAARDFAASVLDELEKDYLDANILKDMPDMFVEMFYKVFFAGLVRVPAITQKIVNYLQNEKVVLISNDEVGRKIACYDLEKRYFGIQEIYTKDTTPFEINGYYVNVKDIERLQPVKDVVYIIAGAEAGVQQKQQLIDRGVEEEQIHICSYFYLPEKEIEEKGIVQERKKKGVKVSVVIPVYNVEQYVEECLQSILDQTMKEIEVICVDDGSTDGSLDILERMQGTDSRIKVISQENRGAAVARNTGLKYAQGKYVMFCDSDDMLKVDAAECLYALAEENASEIVAYDAKCIYMTEQLAKEDNKDSYYKRGFSYGANNGKDLFAWMMENKAYCDSACLMFINRKWLEKSGLSFYAGILYEDCLFSVQCMMKAQSVYHVNEQFYIYRVRGGSVMTSDVGVANVYGRLINLHFFHKLLLEEQFTEKQEWALVSFARTIWYHVQRLIWGLDEEAVKKLLQMPLTHFMKLELEQFGVSSELIRMNTHKLLLEKKLEEATAIEIYGAGVRGHRLLTYLHLNGYAEKVSNFVVSSRENQPTKIDAINVLAVDEGWKPNNEKLLVVAFAGSEARELVELYKNRGVTNILHLDGDVYEVISEDVRRKLMM